MDNIDKCVIDFIGYFDERRDSNKVSFINEKGKIKMGNIIVRVIFALLFLVLIFYLYNRD